MVRKFHQLLIDNRHLPVQEQEELLAGIFNDWKGELEQVDDILVIGIRV